MIGNLLSFPFRVIWSVVKTLFAVAKWLTSTFPGAIVLATVGFILGMKYVEREQGQDKPQE